MLSFKEDRFPKPLAYLIFTASVLVVFAAVYFYKTQKSRTIRQVYNELNLITSLKTEEIRKWRFEHIRDANIISGYVPYGRIASLFTGSESDEEISAEISHRLGLFIKDYDYHSVVIIDNKGKIKFTYPESGQSSGKLQFQPLPGFKSGQIDFSDLHYSDDLPFLHMDISIPVIPQVYKGTTGFGTIILRIDPKISLFPILGLDPSSGRTAETLLIRRDGDSVTYLSKTYPGTNKLLTRPVSDTNLAAAAAVLIKEGALDGLDYMGHEVLAYLKLIPDSPWYIVAKIDKKEALSSLYWQTITAAVIAFLFILSLVISVFYLYMGQKSRFYKELGITKDKFVSIISHDLTSPFVSIVGFAEILLSNLKKGNYLGAEKFASIIHDSSMTAVDLIRDLAHWAKIQTNHIKLKYEDINLQQQILSTVDLLRPIADRKSIIIDTNVPCCIIIKADREMLSVILRNIISNSIKFSRQGDTINVSAFSEENRTVIEVTDTGIGMSKEVLEKILTSDERISTPGTSNEKGSGLGLSLCKEFVSRHGGELRAESQPGAGSRFTFTIPLRHKSEGNLA